MEKIRRRIDQVDQRLMSLISERLRLMDFMREKKLKLKLKPKLNRKSTKIFMDSRLQLAKKLQLKERFAKKVIKTINKECKKRLAKKQ